eukprot:gnl/Carplike_NY0171/1440_a1957_380.p1 GENE.gnl/Carplike_NY0171/1440_a1957_380~~gnl/Carplike_NY0171/1440_a1957_380.p1  ORF type:complete len:645 (+),score=92.05 gnl/Carplike_NY0171/1440_a1957_380:62-1996(+)
MFSLSNDQLIFGVLLISLWFIVQCDTFETNDILDDFIHIISNLKSTVNLGIPVSEFDTLLEELSVEVGQQYLSDTFLSPFLKDFDESLSDFHSNLAHLQKNASLLFDSIDYGRDNWLPQSILDTIYFDSNESIPQELLFEASSNFQKYSYHDEHFELSLAGMSKLHSLSTKSYSKFDETILRLFQDSSYLDRKYLHGLEWNQGIQTIAKEGFKINEAGSPTNFLTFTSLNGSQMVYPALFDTDPSISSISLKSRTNRSSLTNSFHRYALTLGIRRGIVILLDTSFDSSLQGILSSGLAPFYLATMASEVVSLILSLSLADYVGIVSSDGAWNGHVCFQGSDLEGSLGLETESTGGLSVANSHLQDVLSAQIMEYMYSLVDSLHTDSSQFVSNKSSSQHAKNSHPLFAATEKAVNMLRAAVDPQTSLKRVIEEKQNNIYGMSKSLSNFSSTRPLPAGSPLILHVISLGGSVHPYYSFFLRRLLNDHLNIPLSVFFSRMNPWIRAGALCGLCSMVNSGDTDGCTSVCDGKSEYDIIDESTRLNMKTLIDSRALLMYDNVDIVWRIERDVQRMKTWNTRRLFWTELVSERLEQYSEYFVISSMISKEFPFINTIPSSDSSYFPSLESYEAFSSLVIYYLPSLTSFIS